MARVVLCNAQAGLKVILVIVLAGAALAFPGAASAVPPTLISVTDQARQPRVTFSAPKAGAVTVYIATKQDRDAQGFFPQQNLRDVGLLSADDIRAGTWLDPNKIDPGTYYAVLRAQANFDACTTGSGLDPACADGFSDVVAFTVAKPAIHYTAQVKADRKNLVATLFLTATPLGDKEPYRVCYRTSSSKRKCLKSELDGYSWDRPVQNAVYVPTDQLRPVTTFTWYVGGAAVASKRARLR